jgi:hypothetical protein
MIRVCSLAGEEETSNLIAKSVVKIVMIGAAAFFVVVAENAMIHVKTL